MWKMLWRSLKIASVVIGGDGPNPHVNIGNFHMAKRRALGENSLAKKNSFPDRVQIRYTNIAISFEY